MNVQRRHEADVSMDLLEPGEAAAAAHVLSAALRARTCDDNYAFDRFLPFADRRVSEEYWTPLQVAVRAAQWLDYFDARTVVDVGSGVGKFCVAAALAGGCRFIGLEQRVRLITAAHALARTFEVEDRVEFVQSNFIAQSWPRADAYYLYNPFGENLCRRDHQLDADVELGLERYKRDVAAAEQFLESVPIGTFLITYNGFGGRVADSYEEVAIDRNLPYDLRMWRKSRQLGARRVLRSG
jgi:predicted RNA methylase